MELKELIGQFVEERIQGLLESRTDEAADDGKKWAVQADELLGRLPEADRKAAECLITQLMEQASEEGRFLYAAGVQDGCRVARALLA